MFWLFLTSVQAAMNDIDWDWIRAVMNKVNWHSAVHCKNNLIDLDWEVWDDSIEWKSLYIQHYTHKAWFWTSSAEQSRNTDIFFERRIIVTEHSICSFRFSLKLKMNIKFPASQQSSIVDKTALSTWRPAWGQKSVSTCQHMCSEKSVSVYSSSLSVLTCWAEQISILS